MTEPVHEFGPIINAAGMLVTGLIARGVWKRLSMRGAAFAVIASGMTWFLGYMAFIATKNLLHVL